MEPQQTQRPVNKQITYQVGWKKGEIRLDESNRPILSVTKERTLIRTAWHPLPDIPLLFTYSLLFTLPIISLIGTLYFIYFIMK